MKLSLVATVSAFTIIDSERRARDVDKKDGDRRYFQLADMMKHYNPWFDGRKYWSYGRHCLYYGKFFFYSSIINTKSKEVIDH